MMKGPKQRDLYEMIPATRNGRQALACVSAMQKCIRRGMEREAMAFACELLHTSTAFCTMVANRLEIIAHEDIDTATQPWIVPFVHTACQQARDWYDPKKLGKSRMPIGNAIRLMCRAAKSREGDHFQAAIGLASELEGHVLQIPDWAYDQHTAKGRSLGRGIDFFHAESTKLVPAPKPDPYEEEAYRLWKLKRGEE
jgi:replication-associated recombination protein RarA